MEARWLFGVPIEHIDVIIHPRVSFNSMVEFVDGSFKAQMSYPDYAASYPVCPDLAGRVPNPELPKLDWDKIKALTFEPPDFKNFPCSGTGKGKLPKRVGQVRQRSVPPTKWPVELFLKGAIKFPDMPVWSNRFCGNIKLSSTRRLMIL